jgi:WD40 repeat protein
VTAEGERKDQCAPSSNRTGNIVTRAPILRIMGFFDSTTKVLLAVGGLIAASAALWATLAPLAFSGSGRFTTPPASLSPTVVLASPSGSAVSAAAFSPDGQILATCCGSAAAAGGNSTITNGNKNSTAIKGSGNSAVTNGNKNSTTTNGGSNTTITNGNSNSTVISGGGDTSIIGGSTSAGIESSIYLWDVATRTVTKVLSDPASDGIRTFSFSPDGRTLAVADNNGSTYLWDAITHTVTGALAHANAAFADAVAFSPDGRTLATADITGTYLWDVSTGKLAATLSDPSGFGPLVGISAVAFAPFGSTLATGVSAGPDTGDIYLWDAATRTITATLSDPASDGIHTLAFSPDGRTLAVADDNGSTYLWDAITRKLAATLPGVGSALAFSPDGASLAISHSTGSHAGTISLWQVATHSLAATLRDPASNDVDTLAFSTSGALAVGDDNGHTYLWDERSST